MSEQKTETTFLTENGVVVTNSRIVFPGQTFAMSGVTSVASKYTKPNRLWPIFLIIASVLFLCAQIIMVGVPLLVVGVIWIAMQKTMYYVGLMTASGENKPMVSKDKKWVDKVVEAVNEAIVHRG